MKELHDSNLQSCFNDAAFTELTRMILKGTCHMKLDKTGKFLSAILERTDSPGDEPRNCHDRLTYQVES